MKKSSGKRRWPWRENPRGYEEGSSGDPDYSESKNEDSFFVHALGFGSINSFKLVYSFHFLHSRSVCLDLEGMRLIPRQRMESKPKVSRLPGERSNRDKMATKTTAQVSKASEFIAQTRFLQFPK